MREILFRAKRKNWRELPKKEWWVEGNYHHQTDYYGDPCDKHYIIDGTATDMEGYGEHYEIDSEALCQFTEMLDKNGKRIWENDIVKISTGVIGKVIWHDETAGYCLSPNNDSDDFLLLSYWVNEYDVEVIGNVFDDKNLLAETDYCREQEKETED